MVTTPDGHSPIISPQKSRTELQVPVGVRSGVWGLLARKGDLGVLGCQGSYSALSLQLPTKHVRPTFHHVAAQKKSSRGEKIANHAKRESSLHRGERERERCTRAGP